jgi:hypothetical protein
MKGAEESRRDNILSIAFPSFWETIPKQDKTACFKFRQRILSLILDGYVMMPHFRQVCSSFACSTASSSWTKKQRRHAKSASSFPSSSSMPPWSFNTSATALVAYLLKEVPALRK